MTEGYNPTEQKRFRDEAAGNTLLSRINEVSYSRDYLAQIVGADPELFNDAEALIAATYANNMQRDTVSVDTPAIEIPETPESLTETQDNILTESEGDGAAPDYLPDEAPLAWNNEEASFFASSEE